MSLDEVDSFLSTKPDVSKTHPYGKDVAVYSVNDKMFALLTINKQPLQISLRCDEQLATVLKSRYETVMPGQHLNEKLWITVVLSGQLTWQEVKDLINHSFNLVSGS